MAEYVFNPTQQVGLNNPILFENSIGCNKGYVLHESGDGTFILRGITSNCFARYELQYGGNLSIPEGGAVTAIGVAIAVNGETKPSSLAIFTPQAVNEAGNVSCKATVTVPRGCCFSISVRYADATVNDAAVNPTPTIDVSNSNLVITRTA